MKFKFFVLMLFAGGMWINSVVADTPKTISTFQSIGIYWSPEGGADSLFVQLRYRVEGDTVWENGYRMKYNPLGTTDNDLSDYRGSIVNLTPNTTYEIELSLDSTSVKDTITAKTWSEDFPVAKTIVVGDTSRQYNITESGTADGYILVDGSGSTIDVDNNSEFCIYVNASYVIIRGFKLIGAKSSIIYLSSVHDVIIENCDMSCWGEEDDDHIGFGKNYQSAVYSTSTELRRIVVQRCVIHDPRWDSNNWSEYRTVGTPSFHPRGPQAIAFYNSKGNHVFRYNEIWSDYEHMFNDIFGYGSNGSYEGFPNADSDIYGNYLSNCWDDGIESEGANRNVRIWGNYIENVLIPIANAATTIGPLYIWKNTTGRSYTPPGSQVTGTYGAFIKMGSTKSSENMMYGTTYLFNNTVTQPDGEGAGGIGSHYGSERNIKHCLTRNNLLSVRKYDHYISVRETNIDYDYDYDMGYGGKGFPEGTEAHSIIAKPVYADDAKFDFKTMTANFFLAEGAAGVDAGEPVPNFCDGYEGAAPDMGAFETGQAPTEYGINAYLDTPPANYVLRVYAKHGSVTPISGAYQAGGKLMITAVPDSGYMFDHWEGDLTGNANPDTISMDYNVVITAFFAEDTTTAINDNLSGLAPNTFYLSQNYPNPFNPKTTIKYGVAESGLVTIKVYNTLGQEVATLVNEYKHQGKYRIAFNASNLPSGVYVYSVKSGNKVAYKKMLLLK
jgi:hypothetical protein